MELYKKYRPTSLTEVVGNKNTVQILKQYLENEALPHALLFTGPSGCGKTTLARIIGKQVGGTTQTGMYYRELNCASDARGIDAIREIADLVQVRPLDGSCWVWVLDECHQLTKDAANGLLKLLEDTPVHVYFILCTTNAAQILPTIQTRVTRLDVTPLPYQEMCDLLSAVTDREAQFSERGLRGVDIDPIIEAAQGSSRKALVLLDSALFGGGNAGAQITEQIETQVQDLCRMFCTPPTTWMMLVKVLAGLQGQDPEGLRRCVLGYMNKVLLAGKYSAQAALVISFMANPLYDVGMPGFTAACYMAWSSLSGGK